MFRRGSRSAPGTAALASPRASYWHRLEDQLDRFAEENDEQLANQRGAITRFQSDAIQSHVASLIDARKGDRVLDVCCGTGLISDHLAGHCGASVVAVDLSRPLLERAHRDHAPRGVSYAVANAMELCFRHRSFDRIVFNNAVLYFSLDELRLILAELRTLVAPTGLVLIGDVPNPWRKGVQLARWNKLRGYHLAREASLFYGHRFARWVVRRSNGGWLRPAQIRSLAVEAGFSSRVLSQPPALPYHYWRYDVVLMPV